MLITILLACSVSTQFQSSHNTVESFWRCLPLWFIYLSLHVCLGVCTHLLWVIVQHWMCLDAATFMGHACHRTQMHLIGTPGRFFAQRGPHQRLLQRMFHKSSLPARSIILKMAAQSLSPRLSQYFWLERAKINSRWFVLFLVCCPF